MSQRGGCTIDMRHVSVDYPVPFSFPFRRTRLQPTENQGWKRRFRALRDISFHVQPSERIGVVGLNGAGKSTLFRTLAGILTPSEGTLTLNGRTPSGPIRIPVGYIGIVPLVYRYLTGYENLRYIASLYHLENADARIEEVARDVGILDMLDAYVEQYSTGMSHRLDLARALLPRPSLLLLDEPFSSLDIHFAEKARAIIKSSKATVLLATHDLKDIDTLADRLLLIHEGSIIRDVRFEELSEVAPTERGGKALSIVEFVEILLRRSLQDHRTDHQPLYRKYVLGS